MCGIAGGVWTGGSEPVDDRTLDRMTDSLQHRGPDGRGVYSRSYDDGSGIALGHRRLAILDPSRGAQPMASDDGTVWITYNGEFYNYREVRSDLIARGHSFRTDCDTEVLLHLYQEKGVECLRDIRGMFAFAIWDERRRSLFMARDRLGKKPLVYHEGTGRLLFASEIKAILQAPGVPREVDPSMIDAYLSYLYVPHPQTGFRGIRKLPPAHYALFENGRLSISRYWQLDYDRESSESAEQLRERLRAELSESVRLRLRSDVPLGAFLSGGIDSTVMVGLAQRHVAQPVNTFTIGFPQASYDESPFGRLAANHLQTCHHEFTVEPDAAQILPKLLWHFDEPFGDNSAISTYYVAQIAREHVKVVLTGDGGDELFGGYPRYRTAHAMGQLELLPGWLRRLALTASRMRLPERDRQASISRRVNSRLAALREPAHQRLARWVTIFPKQLRHTLYADSLRDMFDAPEETDFVARVAEPSYSRDPGKKAMLVDLQSYLPCDLLAKVDITSMAHGLECRCPLLDHQVVELAASIPYDKLVDGKHPKPMLTSTFPELFPTALRERPKMGFSVPLGDWFRHELWDLARDTLLDQTSLDRGYFRRASIEQLFDHHKHGLWNHGDRIWALLCLEHWHRTFLDPASPPDLPQEVCSPPMLPTAR